MKETKFYVSIQHDDHNDYAEEQEIIRAGVENIAESLGGEVIDLEIK
ncbi:hypothetical protein GNZ25_17850 [Burkholderia thailandensis]|nr:hypothetical protein [Burkholderia thailandensis]MUV20879.1 hypothetical protein [Burkholderia thailandensis]MUV23166.1 hypothetical protein [Burkholderia thailandensis]